ncbi:hypothetical protein [Halodesulfovibrio aestuarii]|uniref:Uncharacterized protein n=1 Tax=Halodesulfovibrio aestuarii TaxID=126333 RepID=A0ABV4JUF7_9BACT
MTSHFDDALKQLNNYISKHGFINIPVYFTAIIISSSIVYGFFYISECGFDPTLYFSVSDYIDAFTLNATVIFIKLITLLAVGLVLLGALPWSLIPKYTEYKFQKYHTAIFVLIVMALQVYTKNISSELKHTSNLDFASSIIVLSTLFLMAISKPTHLKTIVKIVLIASLTLTLTIKSAITDAEKATYSAKQYTIEYENGKKETAFILSSSSNYLLCQSNSNPRERKAVHTRYIRKITPVINDFANAPLALPLTKKTRAGEIHDPK